MTYVDYQFSALLAEDAPTVTSLIMAAMRKGSTDRTVAVLRDAFPLIWHELQARHEQYGGLFPSDLEFSTDKDLAQ
jgi:hypothetical protein